MNKALSVFKRYRVLLILVSPFILLFLFKSFTFFSNLPNGEDLTSKKHRKDVLKRKEYLISKLRDGKFSVDAMPPVGYLFQAEWALVTASMTASAITNIAFQFPETREDAIKEIEEIIKVVLSEDLRKIGYMTWDKDPLEKLSPYNTQIWYLAHLGMVLSSYKYCGGDDSYDSLHREINLAMVQALELAPIPYLETYPNETYSADNTVMYASIKLFDNLYGKDHSELYEKWISYSKDSMVDKKTGIIKSYIIPQSGPSFDSRGSWVGWMSFYLPIVDQEFARDQYTRAKKHFFSKAFGFKVCREFPKGVNAIGDVDSGPVIFGASPSGTGFITGGAMHQKDYKSLNGFLTTAEFIGTSVSFGGKKHYLFSPLVGDAIMLAMKTAMVWDERYLQKK